MRLEARDNLIILELAVETLSSNERC